MKSTPVRLGRAIALSILFFATIFSLAGAERNPQSIWTDVHSWAGLLMLMGSTVHLLTNLDWIKAVFSQPAKTLPKRVRQNRRTDLGLFITGAICAVTAALWQIAPVSPASVGRLHTLSGLFMIILISVHMLQHWQWLVHTVRRLRHPGLDHRPILPAAMPLEQTGE